MARRQFVQNTLPAKPGNVSQMGVPVRSRPFPTIRRAWRFSCVKRQPRSSSKMASVVLSRINAVRASAATSSAVPRRRPARAKRQPAPSPRDPCPVAAAIRPNGRRPHMWRPMIPAAQATATARAMRPWRASPSNLMASMAGPPGTTAASGPSAPRSVAAWSACPVAKASGSPSTSPAHAMPSTPPDRAVSWTWIARMARTAPKASRRRRRRRFMEPQGDGTGSGENGGRMEPPSKPA